MSRTKIRRKIRRKKLRELEVKQQVSAGTDLITKTYVKN